MRIYIDAPFSEENKSLILTAAKRCEVVDDPEKAEIIVGVPDENGSYPNLKLLQLCFAGAEKYCRDELWENGVIIANATGAFGDVISEYVIGAVLAAYRKFFDYRENQSKKVWQDLGCERMIFGERALILGCGNIGQNVAKRLQVFGAYVAGIRRNPRPTDFFDEVYGVDDLDSELKKADLVVCCLPKTPLTDGLLDEQRIALLKKSALVVNVGRGSAINENALVKALENKRIFGAVLDVFGEEPLDKNSPLWEFPNAFITPHISGVSFGHSPRTESLIAGICAYNVANFLDGKPLRNVINRNTGYAENVEVVS